MVNACDQEHSWAAVCRWAEMDRTRQFHKLDVEYGYPHRHQTDFAVRHITTCLTLRGWAHHDHQSSMLCRTQYTAVACHLCAFGV